MKIVPSQRAYGLLTIGVAIAAILTSLFNPLTGIIGVMLYNAIIVGCIAIDANTLRPHRVQVTRHPPSRLSVGRDNPISLSVTTRTHPAQIQLRDGYPSEFEVSSPVLIANLPSHATTELTYTVHPTERGEYTWAKVQVRQLGSWGLAWLDWQCEQPQVVAVYPDLMRLRELSVRLTLQNAGNLRQIRRQGLGTEFAELREYQVGDDPRLIDWKATSRRFGITPASHLQVRVLEPEREQTLMILLDRGRLMTARVNGLKRFDWGLNATLALALAGLSRGDRVGVGVFDREVVSWIPPESGQHHLYKLVECLTPLQPVLLESDYMAVVTQLVKQQQRRALVVLITDLVDSTASAELLTAMMRLTPRYLPFCVTLRDPEISRLAYHFVPQVKAAYVQAVALDLLAQRQVAFAQLKQKGILVLDAPVNTLNEQLVDRYLQLKVRNRL